MGLVLVPFVIYILNDFYQSYKHKNIIKSLDQAIELRFERSFKVGFSDLLLFLSASSIFGYFLESSDELFLLIFALLFYAVLREKVKASSDIVMYDNGMAVDNNYIEWTDIKSIRRSDQRSIIIEKHDHRGSKFRIENIDFVEELEDFICFKARFIVRN